MPKSGCPRSISWATVRTASGKVAGSPGPLESSTPLGSVASTSSNVAVQGRTVTLKRPSNFQVRNGDPVFHRSPSRLGIAIEPTRIVMEQVPPTIPCCGAGCCDDDHRLGPTERLQALLAALVYGRIVQRNTMLATEAQGPATLAALRALLGVPARRLPEFEPAVMSPDEQALLNKPISDLNLSVRARKCMIRLGVSTIAELIRRTGDELLECKNFGVTSLNEVREKLTAHGLKLRGD